MQDEQTDETVEPSAEDTSADTEGASPDDAVVDAGDAVETPAAAIDPAEQLGPDSSGAAAAEAAPEVPDDARDTIARAQQHLDKLDMDAEREAAEQTIKRT